MSSREQFDKDIKETMKFAKEFILPIINNKIKQKLKISGIANIDYSKYSGLINSGTYRYKSILAKDVKYKGKTGKVQFYIGKIRYPGRIYLLAWIPQKTPSHNFPTQLGFKHFIFKPALTKTPLKALNIDPEVN